ncbi:hypothetical protein HGRIS_013886 [Hohenbuehelia grisea]|uniref:DUF6593 domain-containing protein n=1 Tax=Hohenbuehelia grisea TaxID=104357 RepID=A0ABR3IWZ2_9AGAR
MHTNNPYAHAGWPNPNPNAVGRGSGGGSIPPSLLGALPFSAPSSPSAMIPFRFVSMNPDLLNCTVIGPDNSVHFRIVTDNPRPGFTVVHSAQGQGQAVAVVEWKSHPIVEIRDTVPKQYMGQWLALSGQQTSRTMEVRGKRYSWAPGRDTLQMYGLEFNPPALLVKVTRQADSIILEISAHAIHAGLLSSCVVGTVLLLCGRNLD